MFVSKEPASNELHRGKLWGRCCIRVRAIGPDGTYSIYYNTTRSRGGGAQKDPEKSDTIALAFRQLEFQFGQLFANVLRQTSHVHIEFSHCSCSSQQIVSCSCRTGGRPLSRVSQMIRGSRTHRSRVVETPTQITPNYD